jgi:tight adherence protein C
MTSLITQYLDLQTLTVIFAAIAAGATVLTLAMPLMVTDTLGKRMKAVALEREKIRQRERERMAHGNKISLRQSPKVYMKRARCSCRRASAVRRRMSLICSSA